MSAPMDPERLELARSLAASDKHPGPAALLASLRLVIADRDRLAALVDELMTEERDRLLVLGAKLTSPATDAELVEADRDRLAAEVKILESMLATAVQPRIVISGSCLECGHEGDMS